LISSAALQTEPHLRDVIKAARASASGTGV
jgi:hypothetical protein